MFCEEERNMRKASGMETKGTEIDRNRVERGTV